VSELDKKPTNRKKGANTLVVACIPAYNEEENIAKVIVETMEYVDKIVVCDNGSSDLTAKIAEKLGALVVKHKKNMGYGAALATLFEKARDIGADVVVTIDADYQHDPRDIPKLIEPIINKEADLVIGSRFLEESNSIPLYRRFGIKIITALTKRASYRGITDAQSGFRAYSKRAIQMLTPGEYGMGVSTEILIQAKERGFRIKEVPIKVSYSKASKRNPLYHGLIVVTSTIKQISIRHPLLSYGVPGFVALVVAAVFWIWTLRLFAVRGRVVTNVALIAIGATMVGLILLTTAMILWVLISLLRRSKNV